MYNTWNPESNSALDSITLMPERGNRIILNPFLVRIIINQNIIIIIIKLLLLLLLLLLIVNQL